MKNLRNCKAKNVIPFSCIVGGKTQNEKFSVYEDDYYTRLELEELIAEITDIAGKNVLKSRIKLRAIQKLLNEAKQ